MSSNLDTAPHAELIKGPNEVTPLANGGDQDLNEQS